MAAGLLSRPPVNQSPVTPIREAVVAGLDDPKSYPALSEATVKVHVLHILQKLDAADRTEAVTIGLKRGLIHLP